VLVRLGGSASQGASTIRRFQASTEQYIGNFKEGQAAVDEVVPVVLVPEMVGGQPPNR
jgi:hypothetical protein